MSDLRELARSPHFRAFAIARIISNLGNGMAPVALAFAILDLPGATATTLSLVLGTQSAAIVAMLPLGGVIADRVGRVRVVAGSDVVLGPLLIAQATLFLTHAITLPVLIAIAAIVGVLHGIWYPAFPGITPSVVPSEQLQSANSVLAGVSAGANIIGAAMAGVIVAGIGAPWALMFDAFTFVVAGLLVWTLRHLAVPRSTGESTWQQLRTGWREFTRNRWVVVIVLAFTFIVLAYFGAQNVLGPVLMKEHFNGPKSWAVVMTASSIGFLVGAAVAFRVRPKYPLRLGMLVMATFPLFIVTMATKSPLAVIAAASFLVGVATELFQTLWITALQKRIPPEALARVSSYDAFGSLLGGPLGITAAGPASRAFGLGPTMWVAAGITLIAVAAGLFHPAVWRLNDDSTEQRANSV